MTMTTENQKTELEEWLAIRKEAGLKIDPETAEVFWSYEVLGDPYGLYPDRENLGVGRHSFACSPGSDIWVWFGDLPEATEKALWDKHKRKLAFPAGLPPAGLPGDPLLAERLRELLKNAETNTHIPLVVEFLQNWENKARHDT
jgi:hypothetical protein